MPRAIPVSAAILVVEDHGLTVSLLTALFAQAFPASPLHIAGSAQQALESFLALGPHVVVMDVGLPDGSGIDVARSIAALNPATRLVMYSGEDSEVIRQSAAAAGVHAFVSKRHPRELVDVVARLLSGGSESRTPHR